jgi:hypothetical protein
LTQEFVTDDIIYYAKYNKITNKYKVTFYDEDGITILPVNGEIYKEYFYGTPATSIITPNNPSKPDTPEWNYEFDKWTPEIVDVVRNAEYIATYTQTKQKYDIIWKNWN